MYKKVFYYLIAMIAICTMVACGGNGTPVKTSSDEATVATVESNTPTEQAKETPKSDGPIIGYDKVAWGATIEEVKQIYPDMEDGKVDEFDVKRFFEDVNNNGMQDRTFYFYQDKLYGVYVAYDKNLESAILDKLTSIYGTFKREISYKYNDYNKHLSIVISGHYDYCSVDYSDPTVEKEIKKEKSNQIDL